MILLGGSCAGGEFDGESTGRGQTATLMQNGNIFGDRRLRGQIRSSGHAD